MPYRNGRVIDWKWKIDGFGKIIGNEDFSTEEKLICLSKIVDNHPAFDDEDVFDDFADRLEEASHIENEYEQEAEGNDIIAEIYDYADEHLIWLGAA